MPTRPTGYSIGYRFDGIPFDHPMFVNRRQIVERDKPQRLTDEEMKQHFGELYPTTLNKTGVKYVAKYIVIDLIHQELKDQ